MPELPLEPAAPAATPPESRHTTRRRAPRLRPWRRYARGGIPDYLARHYWWAYLSPVGARIFDHGPVINAILFGQYRRLMDAALARMDARDAGRTLQLTCAYGALTPTLAEHIARDGGELHVMDVAGMQLRIARGKLQRNGVRLDFANEAAVDGNTGRPIESDPVSLARMNAESLAYATASFDTVLIFFLLHELPPDARERTLAEALRVLKPGGRLVMAEYGERTRTHPLHRIAPLRWMIGGLEPFLPGFWNESLELAVHRAARVSGRHVRQACEEPVFGGFYRVAEYRLRE